MTFGINIKIKKISNTDKTFAKSKKIVEIGQNNNQNTCIFANKTINNAKTRHHISDSNNNE